MYSQSIIRLIGCPNLSQIYFGATKATSILPLDLSISYLTHLYIDLQ